jgi:hypothetical protein
MTVKIGRDAVTYLKGNRKMFLLHDSKERLSSANININFKQNHCASCCQICCLLQYPNRVTNLASKHKFPRQQTNSFVWRKLAGVTRAQRFINFPTYSETSLCFVVITRRKRTQQFIPCVHVSMCLSDFKRHIIESKTSIPTHETVKVYCGLTYSIK